MKLSIRSTNPRAKVTRLLPAILALAGTSSGLQAIPTTPSPLRTEKIAHTRIGRVVVSLPDRKLALFQNGKVVKIYRVAVGKPSTPSPTGEFKIVNRVTNPSYYHKGQVIPSGRNNPVGSRWMGLSAKGYGIHGTNQPNSIGKATSTGCIRLSKRDLEELFALVEVGDAVEIRAERDQRVASIFGPSIDAPEQTEIASGSAGGQ
jgi:lipoprotein-anchoring transpeptidase ErfK/SrfK